MIGSVGPLDHTVMHSPTMVSSSKPQRRNMLYASGWATDVGIRRSDIDTSGATMTFSASTTSRPSAPTEIPLSDC
eukprot:4024975-Amphidinium_carterae.3